MAGFGLLTWFADNIFLYSVHGNNSVFRIFYSLIILLLSIRQLHVILAREENKFLKNAVFQLCATFLVYYSCRVFIEIVNFLLPGQSNAYNLELFMIIAVANFLSYIIYTIAILCIPGKQEFTMQY